MLVLMPQPNYNHNYYKLLEQQQSQRQEEVIHFDNVLKSLKRIDSRS